MLTARDTRFLHLAEKESKQSDHYRFHIGCVIAQNRRLVASGYNTLTKTHPLQHYYASLVGKPDAIYLHAEMAAIVEAKAKGVDLSGASVYVFRRGLDGDVKMCRPCRICMRALADAGVKEIIYTTDVGIAKEFIGE
jgi:deoxycytidylate deaminase